MPKYFLKALEKDELSLNPYLWAMSVAVLFLCNRSKADFSILRLVTYSLRVFVSYKLKNSMKVKR